MLGKIYKEQSNKTKAIEQYEKFLDLWKDAVPGIAEIEDARKRLAGLKETFPEVPPYRRSILGNVQIFDFY